MPCDAYLNIHAIVPGLETPFQLIMASTMSTDASGKRCFVTIGATASFNSLIRAVLAPDFIAALKKAEYTELRVQYGNEEGGTIFRSGVDDLNNTSGSQDFNVTGFGFNSTGLGSEMLAAKGRTTDDEGLVISHAGSGSILDALRIGVPLVVVPNTDLLHNHQLELAEVLEQQEYVIHGKLDDLKSSIPQVEALRKKSRQWPPLRSDAHKYKNGLTDVIAEEMGWQMD
ncbi:hypothetical protein PV10_00379 [Exophiala mesophila]|uniref:UDP-N-acetylglucosamine transferase subunit ALG13 n=1 Tax=Exophiala mesophila TaxID=212818 RepID=A0A0D1ZPM5_EXOME|nr:uncharacterized protein PV10_00379 [Exophiala mesophila]KIV96527.1 hypothetical protein PV10_00379 [Exophiala mesophila]